MHLPEITGQMVMLTYLACIAQVDEIKKEVDSIVDSLIDKVVKEEEAERNK